MRTEFLSVAGVDDNVFAMPKFMYMAPRAVARIGIDALDKDRGTVIPGWPTRIVVRIARILPKRVLLPILAHERRNI